MKELWDESAVVPYLCDNDPAVALGALAVVAYSVVEELDDVEAAALAVEDVDVDKSSDHAPLVVVAVEQLFGARPWVESVVQA